MSLDRVIQVVMDDLVYYPFHFVEKSNPEHSRKNCKVLRVVRGKDNFLLSPGICLRGRLRKIFLRWNDTPFVPIWDQIKTE